MKTSRGEFANAVCGIELDFGCYRSNSGRIFERIIVREFGRGQESQFGVARDAAGVLELKLRVHGFSPRMDDLQQQMVAGVIATGQRKKSFEAHGSFHHAPVCHPGRTECEFRFEHLAALLNADVFKLSGCVPCADADGSGNRLRSGCGHLNLGLHCVRRSIQAKQWVETIRIGFTGVRLLESW